MILWVDDDVLSLGSYLDELEESGFEVEIANRPEELFEAIKKNGSKIDLVIMDIMLPTGDSIEIGESKGGILTGLRLSDIVLKMSKGSALKILFLTILGDQEVSDYADSHSIPLLRKQSTLPEQLVETVVSMGAKQG